jgi:hypothetical protein
MPDSVIKKVKAYAKSTTLPGIFDFADRNGILFEWNKEVDESPKGIIEVKVVIFYPSFAAEHPGVVLGQDQPLPSIKEELAPQGHAKDAVACNTNLHLLDIDGVGAVSPFVHASVDELDNYQSDGDNGIIAMADIPQQPPHAPLVVNNTDNDNDVGSDKDANDTESDNKESVVNDNAESNNNKPSDMAVATDSDGNKPDKCQGVQRSRRRGKGVTKKYTNYRLLIAARQVRRRGPHRALICEGCLFFSADNLSDAKPIPEEDREEFAVGVALVHYSMNAKGQSRSDQGAHSNAQHERIPPKQGGVPDLR